MYGIFLDHSQWDVFAIGACSHLHLCWSRPAPSASRFWSSIRPQDVLRTHCGIQLKLCSHPFICVSQAFVKILFAMANSGRTTTMAQLNTVTSISPPQIAGPVPRVLSVSLMLRRRIIRCLCGIELTASSQRLIASLRNRK